MLGLSISFLFSPQFPVLQVDYKHLKGKDRVLFCLSYFLLYLTLDNWLLTTYKIILTSFCCINMKLKISPSWSYVVIQLIRAGVNYTALHQDVVCVDLYSSCELILGLLCMCFFWRKATAVVLLFLGRIMGEQEETKYCKHIWGFRLNPTCGLSTSRNINGVRGSTLPKYSKLHFAKWEHGK